MNTLSSTHSPAGVAAKASRVVLGMRLIVLAGLALVGYGVLFFIRNFTGFTELGLTPQLVGGTPDEIREFSPRLYQYISHLHVAVSGFIVALGVAVISLAWNGTRRGERWATWTALAAPVIALAFALPLHYVYGIATMGHLGSIYLASLILIVGVWLALSAPER